MPLMPRPQGDRKSNVKGDGGQSAPITYKYARSEHAEMLLNGRVRISALSYFHTIEGAPDGIADDLEGETRAVLEGVYLSEGPNVFIGGETENDGWEFHGDARRYPYADEGSHVRQMLTDSLGIGLSKANLFLGGNTAFISRVPPFYVLSLSTKRESGLFGPDYDAIVKVPDYFLLGDAILEAANGKLSQSWCGMVKYRPRQRHASQGFLEPNPFQKPEAFAWQYEARIIFKPAGEIRPYLDLQSPLISLLVEREST